MKEQEIYKKLLKKLIDETENHKIQSAEELIQRMVKELTGKNQTTSNSHF